jgi:hypothetical protein
LVAQGDGSMVSEYTDGKQHVFIFKTSAGQMVVGTNSLREVVDQAWFREFLSINSGVGYAQHVQPMQIAQDTTAFMELQREVLELRRRQAEIVQETRQAQQVTPIQQTIQQQDIPTRSPLRRSFLDVPPELMTKGLWESLNTEQQTQWQEKYPPR